MPVRRQRPACGMACPTRNEPPTWRQHWSRWLPRVRAFISSATAPGTQERAPDREQAPGSWWNS